MNMHRNWCVAVALWAGATVSAQADDLLNHLSAPPEGLAEVVAVHRASDAGTVQQISNSTVDGVPCGAACRSGCNSDGGCGPSCGCNGGGANCGCDSTFALDGLLDPVLGLPDGLLGIDLKGDHCFDRFIEPVTNSVYFEDPRARTRVRFLFINQNIPERTPVLQGGDFQVYGMQATFALNDRLAIIAQKDGWISLQADGIPNQSGWANLATGLKYVLHRDVEQQFIVSTGLMFEWTNGSSGVFQGQGQPVWTPFITVGKEFNCDTHFVGTFGGHWAQDGALSSSVYYSLHLDHQIFDRVYAFGELNGLHYTDGGRNFPLALEGGDLVNLGSSQASGLFRISAAVGLAAKLGRNWETATAYETPLADKGDIMQDRLTFTLSYTY